MCGIAGVAALGNGPEPAPAQIRPMCDALRHRGPDGEAVDVRSGVGLGMRRLAVIDVTGGQQPFFSENGMVRAVFNGEIYNFQELRRDLEVRGHRFASRTDGEVIVHLWEEYGPEFLSRLNGMFALALHDAAQQRLVLARDRLGIKPLYYARASDHLVFGSEIKAILAAGLIAPRLDHDALAEFLTWEYIPAPRTLFEGIQKLRAGEMLEAALDTGSLRLRRWWDVPAVSARDGGPDDAGWMEAVSAKLTESVRRQLVSDVPLGAFLSGGVDSSLVVSSMGRARVFTIAFDEPSYTELGWARRVAAHLGVEHRVEIIRANAVELFDRLMGFMEDPIADVSIFPTFLVSRLAREDVTVALSGDGGDELFGGYPTYAAQELGSVWQRIPGPLRRGMEALVGRWRPRPKKQGLINQAKRFVEGVHHPAPLEHARWRLFAGEALRGELFTPEAAALVRTPMGEHIERLLEDAGSRSPLARRLYVDVKSYLVDNCLLKVDRMSMACSLEVRVPFLDHELVELAFRVPDRLKLRRGRTKVLLKRVAATRVPRAAVYRRKEGFSVPMKHWLCGEFRPLLEELLSEERLRQDGLFRPPAVERLKREHLSGLANHSHVLWSLMLVQDWRTRWSA